MPVGYRARVGGKVAIWVNERGVRVLPPWTRSQTVGVAILEATAVPVGMALVLAAGIGIVRRALDRRRHALWTSEWAQVGPSWTGRP